MPHYHHSNDLDIYYLVDNFTPPWEEHDSILMIHGNCESSLAWYGWVPQLSSKYQVIRPDMRGFGNSTPMDIKFPWTLDILIDDYIGLMNHLRIHSFHIIAAKIGGTIARAFAAREHKRVKTLTLVGTPTPYRPGTIERIPEWVNDFEANGIEPWAKRGMLGRLGDKFPNEGAVWWAKYMGQTSKNSQIGFISTIACADISDTIKKIKCPTLVITTEGSGLASVKETSEWQSQISHSKLVVIPGNSYHVAASDPEVCAKQTLEFIDSAKGLIKI